MLHCPLIYCLLESSATLSNDALHVYIGMQKIVLGKSSFEDISLYK